MIEKLLKTPALILKASSLSKQTKVLFTILGTLLLLLLPPDIFGEIEQPEMDFGGKTFSLSMAKVRLKTVFTKIEEDTGIWFKMTQSLAEEKISTSFSDLSLREGIERILRNFDYGLHFDQNGKLLGVTILGRRETSDYRSQEPGSNSRRKSGKGFHPKTLFGLEWSSREIPISFTVINE